jgi:hypothetical protein
MTFYAKPINRPLALEGWFEKPKNKLFGHVRVKKFIGFCVSLWKTLIIIHRCFKGCHAIPTPLPHSVKYIFFNSGLPDNFHFIDEK